MRVVIADDHDVVRKGVRSILESRSDVSVVGEASNGKEALQQAVELKPDLIVLDVSMPSYTSLDNGMSWRFIIDGRLKWLPE